MMIIEEELEELMLVDRFYNLLHECVNSGKFTSPSDCIHFAIGWFEESGSVPVQVLKHIYQLNF